MLLMFQACYAVLSLLYTFCCSLLELDNLFNYDQILDTMKCVLLIPKRWWWCLFYLSTLVFVLENFESCLINNHGHTTLIKFIWFYILWRFFAVRLFIVGWLWDVGENVFNNMLARGVYRYSCVQWRGVSVHRSSQQMARS